MGVTMHVDVCCMLALHALPRNDSEMSATNGDVIHVSPHPVMVMPQVAGQE